MTTLIDKMNFEILFYYGFKIETREDYDIEYLEYILEQYAEHTKSVEKVGTAPPKQTKMQPL